jgi:hypothetical protein
MRQAEAQQLMTRIEQAWITLIGRAGVWIRVIDGKPLTVSGVSKDADAGYGRVAGGKAKGYKLYAVWPSGPLPFGLGPHADQCRRAGHGSTI